MLKKLARLLPKKLRESRDVDMLIEAVWIYLLCL